MFDVIKDIARPSKELIEALSKLPTATIHEAMGRRGALPHVIKPIWPGSVLFGPALTVKARPGDNLMLHKAITLAQPGDILVVDNDGFVEAGMWGEVTTTAAMQRGIAGMVTNGAVRDTMQIRRLGFPVFSAGVSIKGTTKITPGKINHPLSFDGVTVQPGDIIIGDNDGVVVIPREEAQQALQAAAARERSEAELFEQIRAGRSTMDLLGFNEPYNRLGLSEEE